MLYCVQDYILHLCRTILAAPIPTKGMVWLAALASIEFFSVEGVAPPAPNLEKRMQLRVQPDGLCFWSCLFLFYRATTADLCGWYFRARNKQGFPSSEEASMERRTVLNWATGLSGMPSGCKERLQSEHSVEEEDIASWS